MKSAIKVVIFTIAMVTVLNAKFGATKEDCAFSINTYAKYAKRVVTSLDMVGTADSTDIDLAIKYGVDTLSDCEKYVDKDTLKRVRKQIKFFSGDTK